MGLNLDNMLKAMHNSVIEAQKLTEQQHVRMLHRYFYIDKTKEEIDPEDFGKPKTMPVKLPYVNKEGVIEHEEVDIPIISITPPTSIKIKNMKISFEAQISGFENTSKKRRGFNLLRAGKKDNVGKKEHEDDSHQGPLMLDLKNSRGASGKGGTMAKIEIEFMNGEEPEAVARINDQIIRSFPF